MPTLERSALACKVEARNLLNSKALEYQREMVKLLTPYLGKKVRKVSGYGGWVKAVSDEIQDLDRSFWSAGFKVHCAFSVRRFWAEISYSYKLEGSAGVVYLKESVWLGYCCSDRLYASDEHPAGVLTELAEAPSEIRTDWTVEEVEALKKEQQELSGRLRSVESSLREVER